MGSSIIKNILKSSLNMQSDFNLTKGDIMDCLKMKDLECCSKCGNSHEGSCSTEAVYFYWFPECPYDIPSEVLIVGDWTKWHRREKMNRVVS